MEAYLLSLCIVCSKVGGHKKSVDHTFIWLLGGSCRDPVIGWIMQRSGYWVDHAEILLLGGSCRDPVIGWIMQRSGYWVDHAEIRLLVNTSWPDN